LSSSCEQRIEAVDPRLRQSCGVLVEETVELALDASAGSARTMRSRPRGSFVTRLQPPSSTATCFWTAANDMSYAGGELRLTDTSPTSVRRTMSRRVASASARKMRFDVRRR
jgi:hypothetical protein